MNELYKPLLDDLHDIFAELTSPIIGDEEKRAYIPTSFLFGSGALSASGRRNPLEPDPAHPNDDGSSGLHCVLLSGAAPFDTFWRRAQKLATTTSLSSQEEDENMEDEEEGEEPRRSKCIKLAATLAPVECEANLSSAIKIVQSRLSLQAVKLLRTLPSAPSSKLLERAETLQAAASGVGDPLAFQELLQLLVHEAKVPAEQLVITLCVPNAPAADQQTLADLLYVLQCAVQPAKARSNNSSASRGGKVVLLASASDKEGWMQQFPQEVLMRMELEHLSTPSRTLLFERIVETVSRSSVRVPSCCRMSAVQRCSRRNSRPQQYVPSGQGLYRDELLLPIGPEALDLLQEIHAQTNGDLAQLQRALVLLHHEFFHSSPYSVFALCSAADETNAPPSDAFSADFWNAARVRILEDAKGTSEGSAEVGRRSVNRWLTLADDSGADADGLVSESIVRLYAYISWQSRLRAASIATISRALQHLVAPVERARHQPTQWWRPCALLRASLDIDPAAITPTLDAIDGLLDYAEIGAMRAALLALKDGAARIVERVHEDGDELEIMLYDVPAYRNQINGLEKVAKTIDEFVDELDAVANTLQLLQAEALLKLRRKIQDWFKVFVE